MLHRKVPTVVSQKVVSLIVAGNVPVVKVFKVKAILSDLFLV